jgi:hypothetical protein
MSDGHIRQVLARQKALVVGIANAQSIAYGCAKAFRTVGADVAITWLNESARSPSASWWTSSMPALPVPTSPPRWLVASPVKRSTWTAVPTLLPERLPCPAASQ